MNTSESNIISTSSKKIAGNFISTILSNKAEQIKNWITEFEIKRLASNHLKVESILESYVARIIERCTEVSTLVCPQEKIPLEAIYEPITLEQISNIRNTNAEIKIDLENTGKSYIIVDDAGMGKSTFSRNLAIEIILNTEKLPIFFEFSEYEKDLSLVENISKEFNELGKPFNPQLLNRLIVDGKFFIILDGFDEIPRDHQKKISKEISELNNKKGKSSILLTSRPHEKLPTLSKSKKLRLNKLSEEQSKKILIKYDKLFHKDIGANLIGEIDKIPKRFLETPLLVGLLYRTYGFNKSIAKKTSVFYPEIYEALYKGHDLTKSGLDREKESNLEIDKFRKLLSAVCFLYIIDTEGKLHSSVYFIELIDKAKKISGINLETNESFFNDLLTAVPLMIKDGNTYKFIHRTIAEFFCAEFISNNENGYDLISTIISAKKIDTIKKSIDFLYEINELLYNKVINKKLCINFINETSRSRKNKFHKTESFLFDTNFLITERKTKDNEDKFDSKFFLPLKIYDGKVSKSLMVSFKSKRAFLNGSSAALFDYEKIEDHEANLDFEKLAETLFAHIKEEKTYTLKSKEISELFRNDIFLSFWKVLLNIRDVDTDEERENEVPFISLEKCKNLIKKMDEIEKSNDQLKSMLEKILI